MADSNNSREFLGGGPKFNKVGEHGAGNPEIAPDAPRPNRIGQTLSILLVVLLLAGALYFLSDHGLGGVTQTSGHGGHGVSPNAIPEIAPDKVSPNGR